MKMLTYKNKFVNNYNETITGMLSMLWVRSNANVLYSAEEARVKGRNMRGRPTRKRKARKESEESSDDEESINDKNGKPGDEDEDDIKYN